MYFQSEAEIFSNIVKNLVLQVKADSLEEAEENVKEFMSAHHIQWAYLSTEAIEEE